MTEKQSREETQGECKMRRLTGNLRIANYIYSQILRKVAKWAGYGAGAAVGGRVIGE